LEDQTKMLVHRDYNFDIEGIRECGLALHLIGLHTN